MSESDFDRLQKGYYQHELNRGLPVQKQFDANTISAALGISTDFQPNVRAESISTTLGVNSPAIQRDNACRAMLQPSLGMRPSSLQNKDVRTGCGWWFVPDKNQSSIGAYGTRRGPMSTNLQQTVGTGRWIWDAREAVKAEGMKQASKLLSCADLQHSTYPGVAWCPGTDGTGKGVIAGPDNTTVFNEQYCPTNVITDYTKCPVPLKPVADITTVCTPQNGVLSPACLQMKVRDKCSSNGALFIALQSGYAGADPNFSAMNKVLQDYQFTIPSGIVSDGRMSLESATNTFQQISQIATQSTQDEKQNAAAGLCTNAAVFNACKGFGPNDTASTRQKPSGGYPPTCITSAANALGWTSGNLMPSNGGMSYWNTHGTWREVLASMKRIYEAAINPGPEQIKSIKQVFGVDIVPPQNNCEPRIIDYLGCYRDDPSRTIPNQRNNVYNSPVTECADMAKQYGDNIFGLQYGYQCFTGKDSPYNRIGQVPNNACGTRGDAWTQQVYKIGTMVSKPTFYPDTNFRGGGVGLDKGRYPFNRFISFIGNDTVSSIRVPTGYSVTVYLHGDIGSSSLTFTSDVSDLSTLRFSDGSSADNNISALVIA